ncbi:hypothetical protein [Azospirillum argentinense]|uniref:hypothetical protein n=1 Tax=Azospirillum argentinense TaxID=2970906 RepID=UPI0032DFC8FF
MIEQIPFVALCGDPGAGKSTAAEILAERYGTVTVDDGQALRMVAVLFLGATHEDVHTAEGKARKAHWPDGEPIVDVENGEHLTWRQVLGRLGDKLEELLGTHALPRIAVNSLRDANGDLAPGVTYVFPSCRKDQGWYYKDEGGIVLGLRNPEIRPSGNAFDRFDHAAVDAWVGNRASAGRVYLAAGLESALREALDQPYSEAHHEGVDPLSPARGILNAALITGAAVLVGCALGWALPLLGL